MINTILYQKNKEGKLLSWSIKVEHHSEYSEIISFSGQVDGAKIKTVTPITDGSNEGKSNEKSFQEQAEFDAQSEIAKKKKSGMVEDPSKAKEKHETATIDKPMKGEVYRPIPVLGSKSYTLKEAGYLNKIVGLQKKLDGWRFRVFVTDEGCTFYTASGDETLTFPQIEADILRCYNNSGLDTEIILDGELYHHEIPFDEIQGACNAGRNKGRPKTGQDELQPKHKIIRDKLQFHIFDVIIDGEDMNYDKRMEIISNFHASHIKVVETHLVIATDENLQTFFLEALKQDYEGIIIRNLSVPYAHNKNRKNFLKWKPMIDREAKIIGFKKSITGDTLGSIACQFDNGVIFDTDLRGTIGTDAYKQFIWNNQHLFLDKFLVCSFLNLTEDGKPRHPRASRFREPVDMI